MAIIGLEKLYYALLTKDDATTLTYGTPVYLAGVKQISINPKSSTETLRAENKVWEQDTTLESVDVSISLADLTNAERAILLGQTIAEEGGVFATGSDIAPYIALLYKANKTNGQARYQVLYKGKLTLPQEGAKGKEGKTEFQTQDLSGIFQTTINNDQWKYNLDSDDPDCPANIETTFFTSVIKPTKKVVTP